MISKKMTKNIAVTKIVAAKDGKLVEFPEELDNRLKALLSKSGIEKLFLHQKKAISALWKGKNVVITSGVDSGKSLCYQIPIFQTFLKEQQMRALLLFPTKALTQDQEKKFKDLIFNSTMPKISSGIYDGDTSAARRQKIRKKANLVFTNPDMLHLGILPHHTKWADFFRNLRYIIIDEVHIYRGIFGSQFANVLRRLKRIAAFYHAYPQFILTSATLSNVKVFSQKLTEEKIEVIAEDSSPHGEKKILIYNPPIIDHQLGIRKSAWQEIVRFGRFFLEKDLQTLIFTHSRRMVELILKNLRSKAKEKAAICGYRSGYLAQQRRQIEKELRAGKLQLVISTNALELGIDIGGLDVVVVNGYPGSISALRQQFGRAGRKGKPSLCILIANSNLLNQYLVQHPDYIFEKNPEEALIDPDNPFILLQHLKCALYEKPFLNTEKYGDLDKEILDRYLEILQDYDLTYQSDNKFFWKANSYPAGEMSLRSAGTGDFILKDQEKTIGFVDENSVYWLAHPNAVYLHLGETYIVHKLNEERKLVEMEKKEIDHYTQSISKAEFDLIKEKDKIIFDDGEQYFGQIEVIEQVTGFKKIKFATNEIIGIEKLELPSKKMVTYGYWFTIGEKIEDRLIKQDLWNNVQNNYGKNWDKLRKYIRARDEFTCQHCGKTEGEKAFHVHHKIPFKRFSDPKKANDPDNLITLCPSCHRKAERSLYLQSGLAGFAYLLRNIAPFFLMCDQSDIRVQSAVKNLMNCQRPAIIFYDAMPGGLGLSRKLFDIHFKLLREAQNIILNCPCEDGCPACVGPVAENGKGAKKQVRQLLQIYLELNDHE